MFSDNFVFWEQTLGETLMRAVSPVLTGLSDGISVVRKEVPKGLDDNTLGAEDNFPQSERLSSGARSRFQGLGWS